MITLTKIGSVTGGQSTPVVDLVVQAHDIIFANCSYYHGEYSTLIASGISVEELGRLKIRTIGGYYFEGDIIGVIWEALESGTLTMTIHSRSMSNLDLYAVNFRPSTAITNVNTYIKTLITTEKDWTEALDVYGGEYLLCAQYSSGWGNVDSSPVGAHKGGSASIITVDWALPEGDPTGSNSFVEIIKVNSSGTFKYYGLNPTVMRITIPGDPVITRHPFGSFVLM